MTRYSSYTRYASLPLLRRFIKPAPGLAVAKAAPQKLTCDVTSPSGIFVHRLRSFVDAENRKVVKLFCKLSINKMDAISNNYKIAFSLCSFLIRICLYLQILNVFRLI